MCETEEWDKDGYPLIGPHAGRELELMLAGSKPMAVFSVEPDMLPEHTGELFEPYVERGLFLKLTEPGSAPVVEKRWYCLRSEEWRGKLARLLYRKLLAGELHDEFSSADLHRIDGYLLGYSKECVDHFVNEDERRKIATFRPNSE